MAEVKTMVEKNGKLAMILIQALIAGMFMFSIFMWQGVRADISKIQTNYEESCREFRTDISALKIQALTNKNAILENKTSLQEKTIEELVDQLSRIKGKK